MYKRRRRRASAKKALRKPEVPVTSEIEEPTTPSIVSQKDSVVVPTTMSMAAMDMMSTQPFDTVGLMENKAVGARKRKPTQISKVKYFF